MKTDDLIRTLSVDNTWRQRSVGTVLAVALLAAAPVSIAMFFSELGIRPDVAVAVHNPFFDLKFMITIALALSGMIISLHLSRPEVSIGWTGCWLALPVALLGIGIVGEIMVPHRLPWTARLIGSNSRVCMTAIPILSLPLLAAALIALRRGAPRNPTVAGAFAGLIASGLAATLYAAHCPDDSPFFVATWYLIATAIVVAIGAFAGSKVLKI
jgi:hypothetical protein